MLGAGACSRGDGGGFLGFPLTEENGLLNMCGNAHEGVCPKLGHPAVTK